MSKTCSRCRKQKDESCFNRATGKKSGLHSYCKDCMRAYYKENYDQAKRRHRWDQRKDIDKLRRFIAKYDKIAKNEVSDFIGRKDACRTILENFIRRGCIRRPEVCEKCRERCKSQAHHTDYSKPLFVVWLCKDCHWKEHSEK